MPLSTCIISGCLSLWDFPGGTGGEESTCSAGDSRDAGSIPVSGRSPGEGNGNSLQYSCLAARLSLAGYSPLGSQRVRHK